MSREHCHRCGGSGLEPDWRGLGAQVRSERVRRNIGLRQAAKRIGVSPSHVSDLERGNRSWQGAAARKLLRLIGVSATPSEERKES